MLRLKGRIPSSKTRLRENQLIFTVILCADCTDMDRQDKTPVFVQTARQRVEQ